MSADRQAMAPCSRSIASGASKAAAVRGLLAGLIALVGSVECQAMKPSLKVQLQLRLDRTERNDATRVVPGEYVVIFGDGIAGIPLEGETRADAERRRQAFADREAAEAALARTESEIRYRYSDAVIGFAGPLSPEALLAVRRATAGRARITANLESLQDPDRPSPEASPQAGPQAGRAMALKTASAFPLPYGLDRIGQRLLDLNGTFQRSLPGAREVHVYVIDSGILSTHSEFGYQSSAGSRVRPGYNAYATSPTAPCVTHGTHVTGTIAGKTMGVAPFALIHSVRVIDCYKKVSSMAAIAGVDWVLGHVLGKTKGHKQASVANMSLEFDVEVPDLDSAIQNSIKAGITYVVAAGNRNYDACTVSPARVPRAITVASVDPDDDKKAGNSGGPCVDLFAPGVAIASATSSHNTAWTYENGTSSAAPHVTGIAALVLSRYTPQLSAATPPAVWSAIAAAANVQGIAGVQNTPNWCGVGNRGMAPNRLLHWGAASPPHDGKNDSETLKGPRRSCSAK